MTRYRASLVCMFRQSPGRAGFGIGLIAPPLLLPGLGVVVAPLDVAWRAVALFVSLICVGMATGLLARGPRAWRGLMAGLVCAAILFTVASVLLEPDNPYAQGGFAVFGFVALSVLLTISASIGLAVVSVARRLRG